MIKINEKQIIGALLKYYSNTFCTVEKVFSGDIAKITENESLLGEYSKIKKITFIKRKVIPIIVSIMLLALLASCWKPISKFIIEIYDKYVNVQYQGSTTKEINLKEVMATYIPDDYILNATDRTENTVFFDYANKNDNNKFLSVSIEKVGDMKKGVDIESAEYKQNPESFAVQKDDYVILTVCKNNIVIEVVGQISKEEAVKIIKGVE